MIRYFIRTRLLTNLTPGGGWSIAASMSAFIDKTVNLYEYFIFYFLRLFSKYKSSSFISSAVFSSFLLLSSFFSFRFISLSISPCFSLFPAPFSRFLSLSFLFPSLLLSIPLSFFLASSLFLPVFSLFPIPSS